MKKLLALFALAALASAQAELGLNNYLEQDKKVPTFKEWLQKKQAQDTGEQDFSRFSVEEVSVRPIKGGSEIELWGHLSRGVTATVIQSDAVKQIRFSTRFFGNRKPSDFRDMKVNELKGLKAAVKRYLAQNPDANPASNEVLARIEELVPSLSVVVEMAVVNLKVGEGLKLKAGVRNLSKEPVDVVGALDGSCDGLRYPYYDVIIRDEKGRSVIERLWVIVEDRAPLKLSDFKTLQPGQSMNPFGKGYFNHYRLDLFKFDRPGTYTVEVVYDTTGEAKEWFGKGAVYTPETAAKLKARIETMPRGKFVSKPVKIEVK